MEKRKNDLQSIATRLVYAPKFYCGIFINFANNIDLHKAVVNKHYSLLEAVVRLSHLTRQIPGPKQAERKKEMKCVYTNR